MLPSPRSIAPPTMTSWRQQGACRGLDPAIFYPLDDEDAEPAKEVCAVCPVQVACLEHALGTRQKEGILGGATDTLASTGVAAVGVPTVSGAAAIGVG